MEKEVHPLSSTCHGDRPAGSTSSFPSGSVNAAPVRIWEFLKWKIRWVRYSLNSELEATPQPCGNGDPFRPSAGGDVSSLFGETAVPSPCGVAPPPGAPPAVRPPFGAPPVGSTPNPSVAPQGRKLMLAVFHTVAACGSFEDCTSWAFARTSASDEF